jgi:hypothetical protein
MLDGCRERRDARRGFLVVPQPETWMMTLVRTDAASLGLVAAIVATTIVPPTSDHHQSIYRTSLTDQLAFFFFRRVGCRCSTVRFQRKIWLNFYSAVMKLRGLRGRVCPPVDDGVRNTRNSRLKKNRCQVSTASAASRRRFYPNRRSTAYRTNRRGGVQ